MERVIQILFLLLIANVSFAADQCAEAVKVMKEGTTFARGSNREKESYEKAIKLCPKLSEAHFNLGLYYLNQSNADLAIKSFTEANTLSAKEEYLVGLGNAYFNMGQIEEAQKHYSSALKMNQNSASALQGLAVVMSNKGNLKEAQDLLKQALEILPDSPEIYYNLGVVLERLGNSSAAVKSFRTAIEKRSNFPKAHLGVASIYMTEGKFSDAEGIIKSVLAIEEDNQQALFLYGKLMLETGELSKAQEYFERVEKLSPNYTKALVNLGVVLVKLGRVEEGISKLKAILDRYPQDPDAPAALGWAYLIAVDYPLAEKFLNQALERDPGSSSVRKNLASVLSATGREAEAKKFQN